MLVLFFLSMHTSEQIDEKDTKKEAIPNKTKHHQDNYGFIFFYFIYFGERNENTGKGKENYAHPFSEKMALENRSLTNSHETMWGNI